MSAILEAPAPKTDATVQQSEWCRTTLEHLDLVKNAEKLLSEDVPAELGIDDCLRVRQAVAERPSISDQLRYSQLPAVAQETMGGLVGDLIFFAGKCAGDAKKESVGWALTDMLAGIEEAIVQKLAAGEPAELLLTEDVGRGVLNDGLLLVNEKALGREQGYLAGLIGRLPPDHPARTCVSEPYFVDTPEEGPKPVLVLGPFFGPAVKLNRFYCFDRIAFWTDLLVKTKERRNASRPLHQLSMEQIEKAKAALALQNRLAPKPPPTPPTVTVKKGWLESVLTTLTLLPKVSTLFKKPGTDVPLADLLAVRNVLVRTDNDPALEDEQQYGIAKPLGIATAAGRWAARYCGASRREKLRELLTTLIVTLDKRLDRFVDEGSLWAASRHLSLEAELEALKAELAELRARRK